MEGSVLINRDVLKSEMMKDASAFSVWIELAIMASVPNGNNKGVEVREGQCLAYVFRLARQLNMNGEVVNNALNKLQELGEISIESTKAGKLITILKHVKYED